MKKIILSFFLVVTFSMYVFYKRNNTSPVSLDAPSSALPHPIQSNTSDQISHSISAPSQSLGKYRDGEYAGSVEDVFYGLIQIKAVIENGKIADIKFLQYPNDVPNSRLVSSQSLPILRTEAIQSQSANVDIVTGATETSVGFKDSLANALQQAR